jgi:sugar phosphate isomerase/epimerase
MKNDRRKFLQVAGTLTAGAFLFPQLACNDSKPMTDTPTTPAPETTEIPRGSLDKFGIQLYTLRDDMPKDPKGILKQIASFGFQQIEGYEGDQGMFWDMGHLEFKKYLDSLGLNMVSSHCDIKKDFEVKAAQAAEIGMKYLICPHIGPQTSVENWKKVTDRFNECGEICKKNGIRFAYHNHAYSFKAFSGMIPHNFMMENTDPELVDFEMDIYWVVTGGADPIEYLTKYPNRFRLCHVKDRMKDAPADERSASCDLGTGMIDYPKILKVAKEQGMEYFILEQERYDNSTPIKSAAAGADYLKKLVFA